MASYREGISRALEYERQNKNTVLVPLILDDSREPAFDLATGPVMIPSGEWDDGLARHPKAVDFRRWRDPEAFDESFHRLLAELFFKRRPGRPRPRGASRGRSW